MTTDNDAVFSSDLATEPKAAEGIQPMRKASTEEISRAMTGGIVFKGSKLKAPAQQAGKVKTKAKKKAYITGAHGSGAAKKKADIRTRRANRHKNK